MVMSVPFIDPASLRRSGGYVGAAGVFPLDVNLQPTSGRS